MSTWLTEKEYRQSGALSVGMSVNVAFLDEIKSDFDFRSTLNRTYADVNQQPDLSPREISERLGDLRDQLETYFAMEEFYGYFRQDTIDNPAISNKAKAITHEHETLYLQLSAVIDLAEQIVYHECSEDTDLSTVRRAFDDFCKDLARHEQDEMQLMMQLCNEDLGGGD